MHREGHINMSAVAARDFQDAGAQFCCMNPSGSLDFTFLCRSETLWCSGVPNTQQSHPLYKRCILLWFRYITVLQCTPSLTKRFALIDKAFVLVRCNGSTLQVFPSAAAAPSVRCVLHILAVTQTQISSLRCMMSFACLFVASL